MKMNTTTLRRAQDVLNWYRDWPWEEFETTLGHAWTARVGEQTYVTLSHSQIPNELCCMHQFVSITTIAGRLVVQVLPGDNSEEFGSEMVGIRVANSRETLRGDFWFGFFTPLKPFVIQA